MAVDVPLRPGDFEVDASASTCQEDERPVDGPIHLPTAVEVLDPNPYA